MKRLAVFIIMILIFTLASPAFADVPESGYITEDELYGIWQRGIGVGSGYDRRCIFREDHTFIYRASTFDLTDRVQYVGGTWMLEDGQLTLTVTAKVVIKGGIIVENPLYKNGIIEGGQWVSEYLWPEEYETATLSISQVDESIGAYGAVYMDDVLYGRIFLDTSVSGGYFYWSGVYDLDKFAANADLLKGKYDWGYRMFTRIMDYMKADI